MVLQLLLLPPHVRVQLLGELFGGLRLEVALQLGRTLENGVELVRPLVALEELHEGEVEAGAVQEAGREEAGQREGGLEGSEGSETDHHQSNYN